MNIHHHCPSCSDRAARYGIVASPFGPDQNDHNRVTNHPRSPGLGMMRALARALLPAAAAAAFAVAMQD